MGSTLTVGLTLKDCFYGRPIREGGSEKYKKILYFVHRGKLCDGEYDGVVSLSQRCHPPLLVNEGTPQTSLCCNCYFSNCYFGNSAVTIAPR